MATRTAPLVNPAVTGAPPRSALVKVFALLGAAALAYIVWGWAAWIMSPDFTRTPNGPDVMSASKVALLWTLELLSFAIGLAIAWRCLVRPLIRQRTLTFDGMLVIGGFSLYFWDPLDNYIVYTFSYNTHLVNFGAWTNYIPGWDSPNGHLFPEAFLLTLGEAMWFTLGLSLFGCWALRQLRARYPSMSMLGLSAILFVVFAVLDLLVEGIVILRAEVYAYPGAVKSFTLWYGRSYQFPLYEMLAIGLWGLGLTYLRWYRDDRGRSVAEQGIDRLRIGPRARTLVSLLAVVGVLQLWFIIGYFVPYNAFAVKADTFPAMPSYLRAGICGTGTDYACPSEYVPIPQRNSLKVGPDDPRLPAWVRQRQGISK